MGEMELKNQFSSYVERMRKVRLLSAPSCDDIKRAEDYSRLLLENFQKIGEYAVENRKMLDEILFPLLMMERPLTDEEVERLEELSRELVDGETSTEIDLHLSELISECLYQEEEYRMETQPAKEGDVKERINTLQRRLDIAYARLYYVGRSNPKEWEKLLGDGLVYYDEAIGYLEVDVFTALPQEQRDDVIMLAINGTAMFNTLPYDSDETNRRRATEQKVRLDMVKSLLDDPAYEDLITKEARRKANLFIQLYLAAFSYLDGLSQELYEEACHNALAVEKEWLADPEYVEQSMFLHAMWDLLLFATFRVDSPELPRVLQKCIELYENRDTSDYSYKGIPMNLGMGNTLFFVLSQIMKKDPGRLSEAMESLLYWIPGNNMKYLFKAPKKESLGLYINGLTSFLEHFDELPGGTRLRNYCVQSMAAIHPPTYIHSRMVAKLSVCMTRHLLSANPAVFVGYPGCNSIEDVWENVSKILDYTWHAALYHDIGKLYVLDTIAMYGRGLLDSEYVLLRSHPDKGAHLASRFESTKRYVDVIRGHHRFYDCSQGYPAEFDTSKSPYKVIIDIVCVADCLDAATDSVGRSYRNGKTLEEFKGELQAGAGTRYAPYVAELFEDPATLEDLKFLLQNGRKRLYEDTYYQLKDIVEN